MKQTREQWLSGAVGELRPLFKRAGHPIPKKVRATCGFPSKLGVAREHRRVGECWSDKASAGRVFEIFISPTLAKPLDVLATLAHECAHAAVGLKCKHAGPFRQCALAIGLTGKMTETEPGDDFIAFSKPALRKLGKYPHDRLNVSSATKTQTTRLLKCECPECGYTCRVTRIWIEAAGAPICPLDEIPMEADE